MATNDDRGSKKRRDCPEGVEDHISALKHELLVKILSLLTFKEAARTSVLSKRWVDLWKWFPNLEFDYGSVDNERLVERNTYIQLVSKVLAQHKGPKVNNFRVCLQLTSTSNSGGDIERWVAFAISKGVERLDLEFNPNSQVSGSDDDYDEHIEYYEILDFKCFYHTRVLQGLSDVQFFRALRLRYVHLTNVMVHHLVSSCHLLEKLVLDRCNGLVKVKVTALAAWSPLLPLKHLEILRCPYVKEVEIHAPNLVSFCYDGWTVDLRMENVSSLKEIDLRIKDRSNYKEVGIEYVSPYILLIQHQSKFKQLQTLTFEIDLEKAWYFMSVDEFPFLEQLTVYVKEYDRLSDEYYRLYALINASPSLHRLSLKVKYFLDDTLDPSYDDRSFRVPCNCPWEELRPSIKVFEILGFDPYNIDMFLDYVLNHFIMLEKLIINNRRWQCSPLPNEEPSDAEATNGKRVLKLESIDSYMNGLG
ncbi:Putative F-box/LRR-repeat protein At5g02700 [Linum perenne]